MQLLWMARCLFFCFIGDTGSDIPTKTMIHYHIVFFSHNTFCYRTSNVNDESDRSLNRTVERIVKTLNFAYIQKIFFFLSQYNVSLFLIWMYIIICNSCKYSV